MDPINILLYAGLAILGWKFFLADKFKNNTLLTDLQAKLEEAAKPSKTEVIVKQAETDNVTVDLVKKWAAARKAVEDAGITEAVKSFDDSFKLLNAEGKK